MILLGHYVRLKVIKDSTTPKHAGIEALKIMRLKVIKDSTTPKLIRYILSC